jgi:hypothetical protein
MSDSSLVHISRREYVINCNWKVFADNYLDGGYHVSWLVRPPHSSCLWSGVHNMLCACPVLLTCR